MICLTPKMNEFIFKFVVLYFGLGVCSQFTEGKVAVSDIFPFGTKNGDLSYVNLYGQCPHFNHGFSNPISLDIPFPLYDNLHDSVCINVDGVISFLNRVKSDTPICPQPPFPHDLTLIAPFWTKINLQYGADIFYRQTSDKFILDKAEKEIIKAFPELKVFKAKSAFISTWSNVLFYNKRLSNTFQFIMVTDGVQSFALFLYSEITWTLGTARVTGGDCTGNADNNTAKIGFDGGDGKSFPKVPGSCIRDIIHVNEKSNYGVPGQWVFKVDNTDIISAGCNKNFAGSIRLIPAYVDTFGHVPIEVIGPCFDENSTAICRFNDAGKGKIDVHGEIVGDNGKMKLLCNAPFLYGTGRIVLDVIVPKREDKEEVYHGHLYVINPLEGINLKLDVLPTETGDLKLTLQWEKEFFTQSHLDLKILTYDKQQVEWSEHATLFSSIENSGKFSGEIAKDHFSLELFDKSWSFSLQESTPVEHRIRKRDLNGVISGIKRLFSFETVIDILKILPLASKESCQEWYEKDPGPSNDILPCPPTKDFATRDPNFEIDSACEKPPCPFHPGAEFCIRSRLPSPSGWGQQCCYKSGKLLLGPPGGGTVDKCHGDSWTLSDCWGPLSHFTEDVLPWIKCCQIDDIESCNKYYKKRPSDDGSMYVPGPWAGARGDPHITTFDGLDYTFNGAGYFWLIKNNKDMPVLVQSRMEPMKVDGTERKATIFSAFFLKCGKSSSIQIQNSLIRKVDIFIDGIAMDFNDPILMNMNYPGVDISVKEDLSQVSVSFACGFNFDIRIGDALSIISSCDRKFKGKTQGLLGVFDDNSDNDLKDPEGKIISPSSSLRDIHYNYGVKWRVSKVESLFIDTNKNYEVHNLEDYVPNFDEPDYEAVPLEAKQVCGLSRDCLYDYHITGSPTFAKQTKIVSETLNKTIEMFKEQIVTCPPKHGYFSTENYFPGSFLTFSCYDNRTMTGPDTIYCDEKGAWNGTAPQCGPGENKSNSLSLNMCWVNLMLIIGAIIRLIIH